MEVDVRAIGKCPEFGGTDGQWSSWHFRTRREPWKQEISDTSQHWDRRAADFREHIAIDGSLQGRDAAARPRQGRRAVTCDLSHDAVTMAFAGLIGPSTIHTDIMGKNDGLWMREGCIGPKQKVQTWMNMGEHTVQRKKRP